MFDAARYHFGQVKLGRLSLILPDKSEGSSEAETGRW